MRVFGLAVLLCLAMPVTGGCKGASSNPLLGSWKFKSLTGNTTDCYSTVVFKADTVVISYPGVPADPNKPYSEAIPAREVHVPVIRYMPSPSLVVALTGGNGYPMANTNYTFTDSDHMGNESPYGKCFYERTS
jgi:hypothetical protein